MRNLDFIVLGAQKCGTSALTVYLNEHPEVVVPQHTATFFDSDRYRHGMPWLIRNFFAEVPEEARIGTVGPYYMMVGRQPVEVIADRIAETAPDAKLIAIIRDPIQRAFSNYRMARRKGALRMGFDEAIRREHGSRTDSPNRLIETGLYGKALTPYVERGLGPNLLVVTTHALESDPTGTLAQIFGHIGVDPSFEPPSMREAVHKGGNETRLSEAEKAELREELDARWFQQLPQERRLAARNEFFHWLTRWNIIPDDETPELTAETFETLTEVLVADALILEAVLGELPPWVTRQEDGNVLWSGEVGVRPSDESPDRPQRREGRQVDQPARDARRLQRRTTRQAGEQPDQLTEEERRARRRQRREAGGQPDQAARDARRLQRRAARQAGEQADQLTPEERRARRREGRGQDPQ